MVLRSEQTGDVHDLWLALVIHRLVGSICALGWYIALEFTCTLLRVHSQLPLPSINVVQLSSTSGYLPSLSVHFQMLAHHQEFFTEGRYAQPHRRFRSSFTVLHESFTNLFKSLLTPISFSESFNHTHHQTLSSINHQLNSSSTSHFPTCNIVKAVKL